MGQYGNPELVTTEELSPPLGLKRQKRAGYPSLEGILEKWPPHEEQ